MTRQIDSDAVINAARLTEQGGAPATPAAGYAKLYQAATGLYFVDDNGVVAGPLGSNFVPSGRLTLTTATPVTTADVSAAATLYYTPYNGNMISLYDGERWIPVIYTEKSLDIAAYTASKPYDIFGVLTAGTLALEGLVWTNGTTRATALAYQDGRLVKSGAATRLYLGTIYVNASGGQTDDSVTKRNVWNYYNRVGKLLQLADTNSHTYNSTNIRYWNNNTALFVEYMTGVVEDLLEIECHFYIYASNSASPARGLLTFDGATTINVLMPYATNADTLASVEWTAARHAASALGWHTIGIMEYITASSNNGTFAAARLFGSVKC